METQASPVIISKQVSKYKPLLLSSDKRTRTEDNKANNAKVITEDFYKYMHEQQL